jgi:capsular polysaccharide transport system permease protein
VRATLAPVHGVWPSLRIQLRVLHALVMRETVTRFGRHNLGVLWLVVEPMLFTLGIVGLWALAGTHRSAGFSMVEFAVIGYSTVLLWRNCAGRCSHALEPNLSLLYHRQVKVLDLFIARCVLEVIAATASLIVLTVVFMSAGHMAAPRDVVQVAFGWVLLAWFGVAFGSFVGVLSGRFAVVERIWHPMAYLMFPLSGAMFMVDWLPEQAQRLALYLPMVSFLEYIRAGWFSGSVRVHHDLGYAVTCNLALSVAAMALARDVARRVQPQ